jgi:DNA-binding CsgD family transcriptional regulator
MLEELTSRENDIFNMLLDGISPKEIAYKLNISYHTVDYHRSKLYRKLGVLNIQELFAKYSLERIKQTPVEPETEYIKSYNQKIPIFLIPVAAALIMISIFFVWHFLFKPSNIIVPDSIISDLIEADSVIIDSIIPDIVVQDSIMQDQIVIDIIVPDSIIPDIIVPVSIIPDSTVPETISNVLIVSEENPLIITLNDNEPWGYNIQFYPFAYDNIRIAAGDIYTFNYSFISSVDIGTLYLYFVDRTSKEDNFYGVLSPHAYIKGSVHENVYYNGSVTIITTKNASNISPIANLISISTIPYTKDQPTIEFTRFEIIKSN